MAKKRDGKGLEICDRIQKEFGKRFREARINSKRLQKNVAFEMSLTRTTVSNIERGTQRLYLDQVFQAAHIFGVNVVDLLPTVADIYSQPKIQTAIDAPLSSDASEEVERIVSGLLVSRHGRARAKSTVRSAGKGL
jgi:transcriptional regulator with XRE-family HTH domain